MIYFIWAELIVLLLLSMVFHSLQGCPRRPRKYTAETIYPFMTKEKAHGCTAWKNGDNTSLVNELQVVKLNNFARRNINVALRVRCVAIKRFGVGV